MGLEVQEPPRGRSGDDPTPVASVPASGRFVRQALIVLVLVELVLVYFDVIVTYYGASESQPIQDLCNLVIEGSMGGWWSSALTLLVAATAFLIHRTERTQGRARLPGWALVGGFFAFMALDDGSGLHEAFGTAFEDAYSHAASGAAASLLHLSPSYSWQILFGPVLAAGGSFTLWWSWRRLSRRSLRRLVAAGLACFVLAVGIDFLEGLETPYDNLSRSLQWDEVTIPHFSGVIEEFVEMLGTGCFLSAFLAHLFERQQEDAGGEPRRT